MSEISYACMIKESDKLFVVICKSEPVWEVLTLRVVPSIYQLHTK